MVSPLPPLHAVRAFEAAGRLQSISLAAEQLHVTPAAISRQIRQLEDFLGVQLFVREHRAVRLSRAGQSYLKAVCTHLDGLRRATQHVSTLRPAVDLRLCVPPTFAARWLIPRLAAFHQQHPSIGVQINTNVEWVDLDSQGLDAAIRFGNGHWSGLNAMPLTRNVIAPVCAPGMLGTSRLPLSPDYLAGKTLLYSLTRPDDWYEWMQAARLMPPRVHRLEYESSMLAYQAVLSGLGFGIAQCALVREELASGSLVTPFEVDVDLGARTYYFVWPRQARPSPEFLLLLDWITTLSDFHAVVHPAGIEPARPVVERF